MIETLAKLFSWMVEKFGTTGTGIVVFIAGAIWALPYFGIPSYVAQGVGMMAIGLAIVICGKLWAKSEAEKRVTNPNLSSVSAVPQIQAEIQKLKNTP